jgi:hypothetical protein
MNATTEKDYEYRRGSIEVVSRNSGHMRCRTCGAEWVSNIRPHSNGQYYRGSWTCSNCGANGKR